MVNPFTARRPWATFLIGILLSPTLTMLYLGRASLAGLYFLLSIGFLIVFVLIYPTVFGDMHFTDAADLFELPLQLIGACHATYLAWKHKPPLPVAWYGRWYTVLGVPISTLALIFAVSRLWITPYYLPSESMLPNFAKDDGFFASRRAYDVREPARGDVVVFRVTKNTVYLKRIVGLPHDHIAVRDGVIILNGKPLQRVALTGNDFVENLPGSQRSYIIRKLYQRGLFEQEGGYFDDVAEVEVPDGHYYVLGDNRDNSIDSRSDQIGFVARKDIVGLVILKCFDGAARRFVWQPINR